VILESVALLTGIDGVYFGLAIAAVAGLGGYSLARIIKR